MIPENTDDKNPIIEYFHGKPVRKYNLIVFRADPITYKELLEAQYTTGLSPRQIFGYSSKPCNCCKGSFIHVYTDSKGEVKIKRGMLATRIPEGSGTNKKNNFTDDKSNPISRPDK